LLRSFHSSTHQEEQKLERPAGTSRLHQRQSARPFAPLGSSERLIQPPGIARRVLISTEYKENARNPVAWSPSVSVYVTLDNGLFMKLLVSILLLFTSSLGAYAADASKASISKMEDRALSGMEREWVSLAEAMPADKYNFAPSKGSFEGVRTFEQQVGHVGAVLYIVSSGIIGEKAPSAAGSGENGPSSFKTKDDFVNYLKGAFAYAHKAMGTLTDQNFTEMVPSPFGGNNKMPKGSLAELAVAHSFDHYGQSVVYARMNDVIPPASRK